MRVLQASQADSAQKFTSNCPPNRKHKVRVLPVLHYIISYTKGKVERALLGWVSHGHPRMGSLTKSMTQVAAIFSSKCTITQEYNSTIQRKVRYNQRRESYLMQQYAAAPGLSPGPLHPFQHVPPLATRLLAFLASERAVRLSKQR